MESTTPKKNKVQSSKKILTEKISQQLNTLLLPTLTKLLSKKKVEKRIGKAAKILIAGIKQTTPPKKNSPAKRKTVIKKKSLKVTK